MVHGYAVIQRLAKESTAKEDHFTRENAFLLMDITVVRYCIPLGYLVPYGIWCRVQNAWMHGDMVQQLTHPPVKMRFPLAQAAVVVYLENRLRDAECIDLGAGCMVQCA